METLNKQEVEILQFFKYEHLPEHLQKVSKPFCEAANKIFELGIGNTEVQNQLHNLDADLIEGNDFKDSEELSIFIQKIRQAIHENSSKDALRKLLEAKDCAVRARLL